MIKFSTLSLLIALSTTPYLAFATGIPVVDIAGITQMIVDSTTRAQEFSQSISEARNRLNQLKNTQQHYKSMVEGHYGFEDILSDPNLNSVVDLNAYRDLYDAIDDVSDLRDEFGLYSDNPATQRRYDVQLKQLKFQETLYRNSAKRNQRMNSLLTQFQTANTPSAKEDLANSINFEKMQMQNEQYMMTTMSNMLEKQRMLEIEKQLNKSYQQSLYGDGIRY